MPILQDLQPRSEADNSAKHSSLVERSGQCGLVRSGGLAQSDRYYFAGGGGPWVAH
ncbi:MAG TPA: hypothetical protein VKR26_18155 [Terriglobales bacterium]|nr:hypothetical protein [Terriglobales bacterium]